MRRKRKKKREKKLINKAGEGGMGLGPWPEPWTFVLPVFVLVSTLGLLLNGYVLLILGLGKQVNSNE